MTHKGNPYLNPYMAGLILGVVIFLSFFLTGNGLGASGGMQRFLVFLEDLVIPEHVDSIPYIAKLAGGDTNPLDSWLTVLALGTIIGGAISSKINKRFILETIKGPQMTVRGRLYFAAVGGIITGFGARFARGCASGQGLSGGTTHSVGAWAFLVAFFIAGYLVAQLFRKQWVD